MKKEKELQWFAGIGRAVERLHNLSESYDSASKAFAYQYQSSGNEAVFFDKLDNEKIERAEDLQQVDFTKVNSESLEEFLKNGKEEAVHLFVEDYTKTLGKSNRKWELRKQISIARLRITNNRSLQFQQERKQRSISKNLSDKRSECEMKD